MMHIWHELSWVESGYLYAAPNSLFSHNGARWWFTHAGKAESSAGTWRCSVTVRGREAKDVDYSRLQGRTLRSSAGQWKSELWAREGFQLLQSVIDAVPQLKWPECTDRQGNEALCRVDISTPELLPWKWCAGELGASAWYCLTCCLILASLNVYVHSLFVVSALETHWRCRQPDVTVDTLFFLVSFLFLFLLTDFPAKICTYFSYPKISVIDFKPVSIRSVG